MINLDNIKALTNTEAGFKGDGILQLVTSLMSGLIILLSVRPEYLIELNPFTLMLLSISAALPVWAFNQLLWWYLSRRVSAGVVARFVAHLKISDKEKSLLSFALIRLMKAVNFMHVIPIKKWTNLATIGTTYLGVTLCYLINGSVVWLYGSIMIFSLFIWLFSLFLLLRNSKKIDVEVLKKAWNQVVNNDEFMSHINELFERVLKLIESSPILHRHENEVADSDIPE